MANEPEAAHHATHSPAASSNSSTDREALPRDWPLLNESLPPEPSVPYPDAHWDWRAIHARPEIDSTAFVAPGAIASASSVSQAAEMI